ncbi:LacI family DNA-binding transcriptional regulator [Metabacillus bambusae]|uniref:LacI family DNA-binding transcriptional regulator n=1 Tax=Metabacillus bambusae TaxID=2795218 RepID=A0ABS3N7R6_9BACI|nr:LacI family DNA-binding transcriptional regulator [Metabacillus bambusae]MBO1514090.1 LacI family DNA-binding transcriptional regulator [Metabacillus bambusae]
MKASIYDVANLAGVSISTVSRVLNKSGYVSSKTEKKVYDAVDKLNYIPNVVAQNLAKNETKLIGLYFPPLVDSKEILSSTYILEFIKGVNDVLIQSGYHLLLINEMNDREQILSDKCRPQYYSFIKQNRIDGLILGSAPIACSSFLELLNLKLPMVYIGEKLFHNNGLNVYAQFKQYNKDVLDYFYSRGHRHVAVISLDERLESVIREFKEDKHNEVLKIEHYFDPENVEPYLDLLRDIFTGEDKPSALLVHDLSKIQQTINFLNNIQLSVPEDVSIMTIEHKYQEAEKCFPSVTSVYVPAYQMGVEAANVLFEYIRGSQDYSKEMIIDSKIIERKSVKYMTDFSNI